MEKRPQYSLFPIQNHKLWSFYKKQCQLLWVPEECDLSADMKDFNRLNKDEQFFIKNVLAFFNQSDGIVNENLALRFHEEVDIQEARAFYTVQMAIETIHSEMYSLLIDTYVKDRKEKEMLFNAIETIPAVQKKANWAKNWISSSRDLSLRLFGMAIVEGVFFSGSFASIFWLRSRGLMPGLCKSNDFISRDENLHTLFAAELYKHLGFKLSRSLMIDVIKEAVEIEQEFVSSSLPVDLIGINSKLMTQYIEYTADRVLSYFNLRPHFRVDNPLPYMGLQDLQAKTNFFEARVAEYQRGHNKELAFAAEF